MTPPVYFLNPFLSLSGDKANKKENQISSKFMTVCKKVHFRPTCSYYDFYCGDGAWSLKLSETSPSSSCLCFVIDVCPYFCYDAA